LRLIFYFFAMRRLVSAFLAAAASLLLCCLGGCVTPIEPDPDPTPPDEPQEQYQEPLYANPFEWVAVDGQGNSIDPDLYPEPKDRGERTVAIFYFLWHGCHGYDVPANRDYVMNPGATDTKSPYNIQELLDANPSSPALGDYGVMHHWGEPYLGYYVANDEWVIRKHAQMLVDAGVDVIIFDATNGFHYLQVVHKLAEVYEKMRAEGNRTPQFAFMLNTNISSVAKVLEREIYRKGLYIDLWFYWQGKPLILADPGQFPADLKDKYTIRHSWFLNNNSAADRWFASGEDKWPWGSVYPQKAGTHNGQNECVPVMPATHPVWNIGRSFDVETNTQPSETASGEGRYFKKQFEQALGLDPQLMFFTGWNEWTAQRQREDACPPPYFVDQYNHEFSRDIEPLNGDFGDNYYYMMADFIRRFKGAGHLPVYSRQKTVNIDGEFADWSLVTACWADDKGDVFHRNHFGWGRIGTYINDTGRNDIVLSKVASDSDNIYFYVRTASELSPSTDPQWMQLFLKAGSVKAGWEGYNFALNRLSPKDGTAILEKCLGGWKWSECAKVRYAASGREMELAIPLSDLGIKDKSSFTVEFKWVDNAAAGGDIQTCMRDGDSAPDGRFRYRYKYQAK